jgi:hypothetical protein
MRNTQVSRPIFIEPTMSDGSFDVLSPVLSVTDDVHHSARRLQGEVVVNLEIWLPAMFLLGLIVMGLCYAFLIGCEKI